MQIKVLSISRWKGSEQSLVIFAAEGQPQPLGWKSGEAALKKLMAHAKEEGFTGKAQQVLILHPEKGEPAKRILLVGMGALQSINEEAYRRSAGAASKALAAVSLRGLSVMFPERGEGAKVWGVAKAIVEGAMLSQYRFNAFKTDPQELRKAVVEHLVLLHGDEVRASDLEEGVRLGSIRAGAAILARDLVNEPASGLTPEKLAERAQKLGGKVKAKMMDLKSIDRLGLRGVSAVGRGSHHPPVFIHLHYQATNAKAKIVLVGKGVTFDSGGLDLKSADGMATMKCDMAGAAAVMAVMQAADKLKLSLVIDGFIPAVENMPGGNALKPGDVVKTYNGKTVEVASTDAEGRLILADALAWGVKEKPDHIIDVATLTGACVTALGTAVTGIMGNDTELVNALIAAGKDAGETMWELPLVKEYRESIKGRVADLKNVGDKTGAGAIIGGLFLQEFVGQASWAHLDIAGTAWTEKETEYCPAGATGAAVRSLISYLTKLGGRNPGKK